MILHPTGYLQADYAPTAAGIITQNIRLSVRPFITILLRKAVADLKLIVGVCSLSVHLVAYPLRGRRLHTEDGNEVYMVRAHVQFREATDTLSL